MFGLLGRLQCDLPFVDEIVVSNKYSQTAESSQDQARASIKIKSGKHQAPPPSTEECVTSTSMDAPELQTLHHVQFWTYENRRSRTRCSWSRDGFWRADASGRFFSLANQRSPCCWSSCDRTRGPLSQLGHAAGAALMLSRVALHLAESHAR